PSRRARDPARLGRDERLLVDDREEIRLDELRFERRPRDSQDRLVGEETRPLRQRPDASREAELAEPLDEPGRGSLEDALAPEPVDLRAGEAEPFQVVERELEAARQVEAAVRLEAAREELERRLVVEAVLEVSCGHRDLVEVRHERVLALTRTVEDAHAAPRYLKLTSATSRTSVFSL